MAIRDFQTRVAAVCLVALACCVTERDATAQFAGVAIDGAGVLRRETYQDPGGQLTRQRVAEAQQFLDKHVASTSKLRKVSLTRLEAALKDQLARGARPTDSMLKLAGLTRLQYVFCYPETGDVVIAGPAEAWMDDLTGRTVGMHSGRPTLLLEDLVVALRAFGPGNSTDTRLIGCSIDPTPEGLQRMQQFWRTAIRNITPQQEDFIREGLREALGLQTVSVLGVSPKTHFAQVMVEADYRMKLIGIGLEKPPIKLESYVERANPAALASNAMQRWFFVPHYDCVRVADDKLAMQLIGNGVQLVGEDEVVNADGSRAASARIDRASKQFVKSFTLKYERLAEKVPVYAQLRNVIDMAVAAAFLQENELFSAAKWSMELFADESAFPVEIYNAPKHVETAVTSLWKRNRLVWPIGGGVQIEPREALRFENLQVDEDGQVEQSRITTGLEDLPADRWWWD